MAQSKTIHLDLLRDGPSHNQLLSPLTVYLAACQNRPPEAVRLGVEHQDFLRWQGGLTYADWLTPTQQAELGRSRARRQLDRSHAIVDATKAVTALLGSIRALVAELASDPCDWRHLHLVLDAAELSALPFELAHAAPGLMVEGERLFLQHNARVTLTRQTRRVATSVVSWPQQPRLLCVVGRGSLPAKAHVLALRQAIDPWIGWNDGDEDLTDSNEPEQQLMQNRKREAAQMMTVMINPTLDEVSAQTRAVVYTHVHILVHGAPLDSAGPGQTLYGLSFKGTDGGIDVVDGDRLEAALRHAPACSHPTVVTLATCVGGSISGGILGPGGSVAHALHAKGVPLVVAAQFPLSKAGSAVFAEMMYGGLLRGEDPREVVHGIRRELLASFPDRHDWASLVVYGSFPPDLDVQLDKVKRAAHKLAAETAVERLRVTLAQWRRAPAQNVTPSSPSERPGDLDATTPKAKLEADVDRLDRAVHVLRKWTREHLNVRQRVASYRVLARVSLRVWDMLVLGRGTSSNSKGDASLAQMLGREDKHDSQSGERPLSMLAPRDLLNDARESYTAAFAIDNSQTEVWIQIAFLATLVSAQQVPPTADASLVQALQGLRHLVDQQAQWAQRYGGGDRETRALRAAMAFEISLLEQLNAMLAPAPASDPAPTPDPVSGTEATAEAFAAFVNAAEPIATSYRAHALWRQLRRYESVPRFKQIVEVYRSELVIRGVRRYWGPRF